MANNTVSNWDTRGKTTVSIQFHWWYCEKFCYNISNTVVVAFANKDTG